MSFSPDIKRTRLDWVSIVRATLESVEADDSGFRVIPADLIENYDGDKVRGYAAALNRTLPKFPAIGVATAVSGTLPDGSRAVAIR